MLFLVDGRDGVSGVWVIRYGLAWNGYGMGMESIY